MIQQHADRDSRTRAQHNQGENTAITGALSAELFRKHLGYRNVMRACKYERVHLFIDSKAEGNPIHLQNVTPSNAYTKLKPLHGRNFVYRRPNMYRTLRKRNKPALKDFHEENS